MTNPSSSKSTVSWFSSPSISVLNKCCGRSLSVFDFLIGLLTSSSSSLIKSMVGLVSSISSSSSSLSSARSTCLRLLDLKDVLVLVGGLGVFVGVLLVGVPLVGVFLVGEVVVLPVCFLILAKYWLVGGVS